MNTARRDESLEFCKAARRVCFQWLGLCKRSLAKGTAMSETLFHYTLGYRAVMILRDGVIRRSTGDLCFWRRDD